MTSQQSHEERMAALEERLVTRISHLEHELVRLTEFANAMHGNAYSRGHRRRRPILKVIHGDDTHPSIIAFDAGAVADWASKMYRQAARARLQPVYASVFIVLAVVAAIVGARVVGPEIAPVTPPTHAHGRRRAAGSLQSGYAARAQSLKALRNSFNRPPYVQTTQHHGKQPSVPIGRFIPPPAPRPTASASSSSPATSPTPSPTPSTSSPAPSPSDSSSALAGSTPSASGPLDAASAPTRQG